jgi:phospholipid N-methyltransferase
MTNLQRMRPQPDNRFAFFQGFLQRPRQVGSIVPSSRFLERRIVRAAGVEQARTLVELGPGTGGTTRALLRAMRPDATLLTIEINPRFVALLRRESDTRLIAHQGSAAEISRILAQHGLPKADVVLSGIPFSTMPRDIGMGILHSVHEALLEGATFVAYQVRDRVESLAREVFGPAQVQMEIRNVPPMRVFRWQKRGRD